MYNFLWTATEQIIKVKKYVKKEILQISKDTSNIYSNAVPEYLCLAAGRVLSCVGCSSSANLNVSVFVAFQAELSRLSEIENSLAIFCMATYGEGDPTDNAQDFYDWLQENDDENLSGLNYTVSLWPALVFCCVFLCILVSSSFSTPWYLLRRFLSH